MVKGTGELLQGTLDMLILKALLGSRRHGYGVLGWIRRASDEGLRIEEGALYPALHRLEARGWLESEWGLSENNRQARFYALTPEGRHQLEAATRAWNRYVEVVARVLAAA